MMNSTDKHNNESADHHSGNEDESNTETIVIINSVLNAPLILISILGNTLVLAAMFKTPSIRSTSMIMLCSLAVSDLLVGLLAQPIYIANGLHEDSSLYYVWKMIGPSLSRVSLLTITAITVDQFLTLHYHMRYATLVTESRVKYTLVIIWIVSFLASGFVFWDDRVLHFLSAITMLISLIISAFSYIRINLVVRRHQLQIHAQQQAVQSSNAENNTLMARLKKSAMNTFVFYIALIICYFPMIILLNLYAVYGNWKTEYEFAITLVFSNSSINPFLYCWRLRELRTAVVKTARQIFCKQTEEN